MADRTCALVGAGPGRGLAFARRFAADGYALGVIDTPSTRARMTHRTRDAVGWTNQHAGTYPCVSERRSAKCARLCADTPLVKERAFGRCLACRGAGAAG